MAVFDQAPQEGPQYPYFWAMPTREPKPDESGAIRGEGIGKALSLGGRAVGEGISAINTAEEAGLRNDVYSQGDRFMDKEIAALSSQYQTATGNVPPEITGLPQTIGTLNDARANGKISQTDHDARLDAKAKELRAKYPGYRQEVDEYFRQATGRGSTANQLWESLRGDIDAATAARRAKAGKVETELWSAVNQGVPGSTGWLKLYQDGKMTDLDVAGKLQQANEYKYTKARMEAEKASLELQGASDKVKAKHSEDDITYRSNYITHNYMDNFLFHIGAHDPMTLTQLSTLAGQGGLSAEEATQAEGMLKSVRAQIYGQIWAEVHEADPKGKSIATSVGSDEQVKKLIESSLSNWDTFSSVIANDKDFSAASAVALSVKATQADAARGLQQNPATANLARKLGAVSHLGPEVSTAIMPVIMSNPNFSDAVKNELLSASTDVVLPPGHMGWRGSTSGSTSLAQHVDNLQKIQASPEAYKYLIDFSGSLIGNPKAPLGTRAAVVESVFGLDDRGLVAKFGTKVNKYGDTDQSTVFNNLLAEKNIKEIHKMSEHFPYLWERTKSWAENSWQTMSRGDIQEIDNAVRDFSGPNMGVDFGWDAESHEVVAKPFGGLGQFKGMLPPGMDVTLKRLNKSLATMVNLYSQEGADPKEIDAKIVQLLSASGMSDIFTQSLLQSIRQSAAQ